MWGHVGGSCHRKAVMKQSLPEGVAGGGRKTVDGIIRKEIRLGGRLLFLAMVE